MITGAAALPEKSFTPSFFVQQMLLYMRLVPCFCFLWIYTKITTEPRTRSKNAKLGDAARTAAAAAARNSQPQQRPM
ncbi:hypothetical protein BV898_02927 [Hypsibius exemplaris]|uniref:Uncharacterized protein n=1 Tax=Hypsibius exemplaris TaxID=2072580 RepID=A0A1W0X712_HYPEX|nr:hypothetical protein BV898_02927 [Hypsibius exemplaris]